MASLYSTLVMLTGWAATDGAIAPVCTRRHRHTTFSGYQVLVELRDGLVVVSGALDTMIIEACFIDDFERRYPDLFREVVSSAEWRSQCNNSGSRCRICRLPDELRDSISAEEFVGTSPACRTVGGDPSSPPSPIPQQRPRNLPEPFEAESSSQPSRHRLRSHHRSNQKKSGKPQKLLDTTPPRTMHEDGPEKALHRAVFDYITKRPTEAWMATISRYTKR
ncbi:hypothetical protein BDZ89DRAFT_1065588 [Hymenopellis radicata]|nr:hypothetical protein BDZ89DRAFT_1065588 [Hymenopellis radicata]